MMTMTDDGDRTCPLCAEEMDLTDLQLKPCKCGYDICVWCWHQIMEMAEKESSEGRCPACRAIYDKQKIIATDNCKSMVVEEKKQRSQKTKNKSSSTIEDRKQLSNVRVVQRNLVYVMGMPSDLADENVLERKEYFGQYGKVLKVSISRQAGTTLQQASMNDTFNVYITYAREEDAVRCIQSVHNFVLEDKPLRACFGTTKYCYIWLRNMTCNNPDCLYLHDIGSQEDSFTKDEIISAYTRSRVPQIPSNSLQPRVGDVLPPPADDFHNNNTVSTKHTTKNSFHNTTNQVKSSPMDTSGTNQVKNSHMDTSGTRSTVLPAGASWGSRPSNCRPPISSVANLQPPIKQKIEVLNGISITSSSFMVSNTKQNSAWHEDKSRVFEPLKNGNSSNHNRKVQYIEQNLTSAWEDDTPLESISGRDQKVHINGQSRTISSISETPREISLDERCHSSWDDDMVLKSDIHGEINVNNDDKFRPLETVNEDSIAFESSNSCRDEVNNDNSTVNENKEDLCLELDPHIGMDHFKMVQQQSSIIDHHIAESFRNLNLSLEQFSENEKCLVSLPDTNVPITRDVQNLSPSLSYNHLTSSENGGGVDKLFYGDGDSSNIWGEKYQDNEPLYLNGEFDPNINCTENELCSYGFDNSLNSNRNGSVNREEESIVSKVLTSDFDPWDNSWSSANNFAQLLAQMNNKREVPAKQSSSLKLEDANQSRFSFARQGNHQTNIGFGEQLVFSKQGSYGNYGNTLPVSNFERVNALGNNSSAITCDAISGIMRTKLSPPPGFVLPDNRAPPPGFSSQDRYDKAFNTFSEPQSLNSPFQNQFQVHPTNNAADVEFIDPAILAVSKGRLPLGLNNTGLSSRSSAFNSHFNTSDSDARIQLLMQQSIPSNQPPRDVNHINDRFLQHDDPYIRSRFSLQNQGLSSYSNISHQQPSYNLSSQWNGWNDTQITNAINERFGINNYFHVNEEPKFHISNSGDFYNRAFGI